MAVSAIPLDEVSRYYDFFKQLTQEEFNKKPSVIDVDPEAMLWHYTTGSTLIKIVESGSFFSTQLSGLNDTTELRYGLRPFQTALASLRGKYESDTVARGFIDWATEFFRLNPDYPAQGDAPVYITCFSEAQDDLSQWRAYGGGENGCAIGFRAKDLWGEPNSIVVRVNYDPHFPEVVARASAEKAVEFFREGIKKLAPSIPAEWGFEFLLKWGGAMSMFAPLLKHPGFIAERECRIIKHFRTKDDLANLVFLQKDTLISRHLAIRPGPQSASKDYRLPIAKVMVGPCRHPENSRISVCMLLRKKGYALDPDLVSVSEIPYQAT